MGAWARTAPHCPPDPLQRPHPRPRGLGLAAPGCKILQHGPACQDQTQTFQTFFVVFCLLFSTTQGLSMTKQLLHTKCLPAAHIPSPHLPRAPGAATGGTAVPAALTTGCQALPAGFPSALGWGWGGRLTPLSSPGALARSPQHRPLGKNRKTPGAGCFSDSVPQGPK